MIGSGDAMPHAHGHHNHSTRGEGKEAAATAVVGCVPACCESRVVWALAGDGRAWDARFCDIFAFWSAPDLKINGKRVVKTTLSICLGSCLESRCTYLAPRSRTTYRLVVPRTISYQSESSESGASHDCILRVTWSMACHPSLTNRFSSRLRQRVPSAACRGPSGCSSKSRTSQ